MLGRARTSKTPSASWSGAPIPFYTNTSTVRRLLDAREKGLKIIEVGPLLTPLDAHADIHLRIRPGTSGALALGMAHVIIEEGLYDREFVQNWSLGFEEYQALREGVLAGADRRRSPACLRS